MQLWYTVALRCHCFLLHIRISYFFSVFPSLYFEILLPIFFYSQCPSFFFAEFPSSFFLRVSVLFFIKSFFPLFSVFPSSSFFFESLLHIFLTKKFPLVLGVSFVFFSVSFQIWIRRKQYLKIVLTLNI